MTVLADALQFLGEAREHLRLAVGDDDEVLDSDAAAAWQVDPRLDPEDLAGLGRVPRAGAEHRRLVDPEADPVAEAVTELVAVAGRLDSPACDRVDGVTVRSCSSLSERRLLRVETDCVDPLQLLVQVFRCEGAR